MCGRFAQTKISKVIRLNWAMVEMPAPFQGRFNFAPMQDVPAIIPNALDTASGQRTKILTVPTIALSGLAE